MFSDIWHTHKQWVSYSIVALLYVLNVYFLFFSVQLLYAAISIAGLLFFLHFAVIGAQKDAFQIPKKYWIGWVIFSGLMLFLTTSYNNNLIVLAYGIYHIGLYLLVSSKYTFLTRNTSLHPRWFCNAGMYLFTLFCTISCSIVMVGVLGSIPFDCDSIYDRYDAVWDTVSSPREKIRDRAQWFFADAGSNPPSNTLVGQWRDELWDLAIWDNIASERDQINRNICNTIFENIQEQLQKPWFQAAIIFPLFLILSPIIRLFTYLISWLSFLVMQFLLKTNIYRKRKVMREVEEWY